MIAGKAPSSYKFNGNIERLEGWLLQLTNYFTNTGIRNERQKLAFVGLCLQGKALDWCKANKDSTHTGLKYKPEFGCTMVITIGQIGPLSTFINSDSPWQYRSI